MTILILKSLGSTILAFSDTAPPPILFSYNSSYEPKDNYALDYFFFPIPKDALSRR